MSSSQKSLNGLSELGIQKMQEHLDYYIKVINPLAKLLRNWLKSKRRTIKYVDKMQMFM